MADVPKLLPCPFCGDDMSSFAGMVDGAFATNSKGGFAVSCDCGVIGPTRQYMVDAVVAWNERERRTARGVTPVVNAPMTHDFVPHPKYPWFCRDCGYAPHEPLKHTQPLPAAPSLSTSAGGGE